MKKLGSILLCGAMLCTGVTAMATADDTLTASPAPSSVGVFAEITEVTVGTENDVGTVASLTVETAAGIPLILHLGDGTICVDNHTGTPANTAGLKVGDKIYVYHDSAVMLSEPAQAAAQAILTNVDEQHAPPHLLTVGQVLRNTDGSVTLLTDDNSMLVTVKSDTPVSPLYTKNIVTVDDVRLGTRLFAWYDAMDLSYPGQAAADKVVLLPAYDRDLTIITQGDIAIGTGRVENGVVMVPLRLVAEALGFTVTWDSAARAAHLENDEVQMDVYIGQDSFVRTPANEELLGMTAPQSYGAAAYIAAPGTTWVPAELFDLLLGSNVAGLIGDTLRF